MTKVIGSGLVWLLLLGCGPGPGVRAQNISLSDAIQAGLEENYGIRIARSELAAVENNNDYALTGKYPTVSLGLTPGINYRNADNPASVVVSSNTFSYSVAPSVQANWTLFNGGRVEIAKDQLATLAELSSGQLELQVQTAVQNIVNRYYTARVASEQIDVRERVLELSRDRIEYQDVRREFGQGGTFDLLQSRDAFFNDSLQLEIQQTTYVNAVRDLLQAMGRTDLDPTGIELITELTYAPEAYQRQALLDQFDLGNQTLRNLRVNRELANINTQLIETELRPTVGLSLGLNYDISLQTGTQTFVFGEGAPQEVDIPQVAARTIGGNFGITGSYLLYDGGARNVRIQTAKLDEITTQLNYQSAEQELRANLLNTLELYENQLDVVAITQQLIANAERNIEVAEERFRGGTINSFDYRAIQLNYVNAEFQLLQALLNLKTTETSLLALTGQIVKS